MTIEDTIKELSTPEAITQRMREDAAKFADIAESVSLNREALALIFKRGVKTEPGGGEVTDKAAMHFVRMMHNVLVAFSDDLDEAADAAEKGEMTPRVVDIGIIGPNGETDNGTKH